MELSHLSDHELVDYLSKFSIDPTILRLVRIIDSYEELIDQLREAGMNDNWEFDHCHNPGEHIRYLEQELEIAQNDVYAKETELERLQARSILEYFADVQKHVDNLEIALRSAKREINNLEKSEKDAKDKLKMWSILSKDHAQKISS